mmetsp:Transcript_26984/g.48929  ORF Transcript_26984/g.48929 Transcript_26984/m.48929 type:complete len:328 (+) Transcript_26984:3132-4115(+)
MMGMPAACARGGDIFSPVIGKDQVGTREATHILKFLINGRGRLHHRQMTRNEVAVELVQKRVVSRSQFVALDTEVGEGQNGHTLGLQSPHQAHRMVDNGACHLDPAVMPHADFRAPVRVLLGHGIDGFGEVVTHIHSVVHRRQINGVKHRAAAVLAYDAVIETLGVPFQKNVPDIENDGFDGHVLAALNSRSKESRKRDLSALVKPLPPPWRNGSAARRSVIRSRVASTFPILAAVSASPLCLSTRAPASTHLAARGMSPVMTTSPIPARSAIHMSATSGPSGTMTVSTRGFCDRRSPPFETILTGTRWRVATFSASALTGQASAST